MNQPQSPRNVNTSIGEVFVLGFEGYDLVYVPGTREVVSRLQVAHTADHAGASTTEALED